MTSVKWNKSLKVRLSLIMVLAPLILAIVMIFTSLKLFHDRNINENAQRAEMVVKILAGAINGDSIDRYLSTLEKDYEYEQVMNLMENIYRKPEVIYLYVAKFTDEGAYSIFDADDNEETHWDLGYFYVLGEESIELSRETLMLLKDGEWPEREITHSKWGWLLTVYEPIYRSDGSIAAFACVDISMDRIMRERQLLTSLFVFVILFFFAITILINISTIQILIFKPIGELVKNVSDYRKSMVLSGSLPELTADQIQFSGNELEVLKNALRVMKSNINIGFKLFCHFQTRL